MPHRSLRLLTLPAIAYLLLPGCGTMRAYPGPARASEQVASLEPARSRHWHVYILAVDGKPVGPLRDRVELLPGSHRISTALLMWAGTREIRDRRVLLLEAEAGRRYSLRAGWDHYGPSLRILETGSDSLVVDAPTLPRGKLPPVGAASPDTVQTP